MHKRALALLLAAIFSNPVLAGSYDFCVTRVESNNAEKFHARFKYGDIDPGKEAAKMIVSQRFKRPTTESISVSNYNVSKCPGDDVQEITVSASLEQLQNLGNALGEGNVPGAAIIAADIAAGGAVALVKGTSDAGEKAVKFIEKTFGVKF